MHISDDQDDKSVAEISKNEYVASTKMNDMLLNDELWSTRYNAQLELSLVNTIIDLDFSLH